VLERLEASIHFHLEILKVAGASRSSIMLTSYG
jgi:hypothetical protein